jgi:dihydroflavonol-4-reductase
MMSPQAAGERFLGVGEFMWMADISRTLREQLGDVASEVPTRTMPDFCSGCSRCSIRRCER